MKMNIPNLGDPQAIADQVDEDSTPADLLQTQNELNALTLQITAITNIMKTIHDCEMSIANNFK
jgi:hypothetical protein